MKAQYLTLVSAAVLAACSTVQENPNYQYSSKYGQADTDFADSRAATGERTYVSNNSAHTQYASTSRQSSGAAGQTVKTVSLDEYCMEQNRRRELVGAGVGGAIGAVAGKALIGGTKGALAGAALGGTAGYAAGDSSIDCRVTTYESATPASTSTYVQTQPQNYPRDTYTASPAPASPTGEAYRANDMMGTPGYQLYLQEQAAATPVAQTSTQPYAQAPQPSRPQPQPVAPSPTYSYGQSGTYAQSGTYGQSGNYGQQSVPLAANTGPRAVDYDYSQNVVTAGGGPVDQTYSTPTPTSPVPAAPYTAPQRYSAASPAVPTQQNGYQSNYQSGYQSQSQGNYIVRQGDTVYSLSRRLCVPVAEFSAMNNLGADYAINIDQALTLPASRC